MVGGRWLHAVRVSGSWNHQVAPRAVRASSQIVGGLGATVGQTRGSAVALWGWVGVGEAAKRWRCRRRGRGRGGKGGLLSPPGPGTPTARCGVWRRPPAWSAARFGVGDDNTYVLGCTIRGRAHKSIRDFGGQCGHTSAAPPPPASPTRVRAPQQPATYITLHVYVCGARPGPGRRGVGGPSAEHATCHPALPHTVLNAAPRIVNSHHCGGGGSVPGRPGSTEGALGRVPAGAAGASQRRPARRGVAISAGRAVLSAI